MACVTKLGSPINSGCPTPNRGFKQIAWIGNTEEIETKTYDVDTAICSDLLMASGKKFYPVEIRTKKPFDATKITGVEKLFGFLFDNETEVIVVGNSPTSSAIVNILSKGLFTMIFEQKGIEDNSKYPIIGVEVGLSMSAAALEPYGDKGGWSITLKEEMCESAGMFLWNTNIATTDALVASLTA